MSNHKNMNNKLYARYVAIEQSFKSLEKEKQQIRDEILKDLQDNGLEKVESEMFGTFTVAHKKSWKYSPAITKLEESIKIKKFKEQEAGKAKAVISDYLLYKANDQTDQI